MSRPPLEVADIFRDFGPAWRQTRAGHLSLGQLKVMSAIERCRSAALGGHVLCCQACEHTQIAYNSCRNRHCPKCQASAAHRWLAARQAELLPVDYYHLVFTLPAPISALAYYNKRVIYGILFKTAAETLLQIAADPKHLGARIGATLVLHTWGSAMTHHPHVHGIVPGGGLSIDGETIAAIVNVNEGEFTVCINGDAWGETVFEKIWHLRFSPDGRLTALVSEMGEWTMAVDGAAWENKFGYIWEPRFSIDGATIAAAVQQDMRYAMVLNGEPALACHAFLRDYPDRIRIEPLHNSPIERDLVVVMDDFIDKLGSVKPYIVAKEERDVDAGEHLQTPAQLASFKQYTDCINCLLCYSACPQYALNDSFVGPAALALAHRYNLDSRDIGRSAREDVVASNPGIWECSFVGACSEVCPKSVDPAAAIQQTKIASSGDYFLKFLMPWRRK